LQQKVGEYVPFIEWMSLSASKNMRITQLKKLAEKDATKKSE